MKTLEIITRIFAGGIFLTWILYLAVRCLGNARDYKDRYDRDVDRKFQRHVYRKK